MQTPVPPVAEPAARRSWRARLVSGPVGRRVAIVDLRLYRFLRVQCQVPAAEASIARFSHLGQHAALWLVLGAAGGLLDRDRRHRWLRGATAVGAAYLLNTAIKGVVRRQRPAFEDLPALVATPTALSFPSAHASSSFAAARVVRSARSGDKAAIAEEAWLRDVIEALQAGRPVRTVAAPADAPGAVRELQPLTSKPVLYVVNVEEGSAEVPAAVAARAAEEGALAVAVSSRLEAELSELDDEEAAVMREELGAGPSTLDRVVSGAFALLDQLAFFTAGEAKPAQSWHLRRGLTAWHAAGEIHTDIQKGFVRAEVIGWEALVEAGGYAGARSNGSLRLEGRDYVMADGDVITVKFTP
jgi:hypothetical protein